MRKIKWGVIGCGGIAYRRTIPDVVANSKLSEIIAVMDVNADMAKKVAGEFNFRYCYNSAEDMLANRDIEAVYIATPVHKHKEQIILSAKHGKHVLVEKTITNKVDEAKRAIDACAKNKVKLMVAYMMRFQALHRKAQEIVANGQLGKIVLGRAQLTCWYPKIKGAWRQDPKYSDGGSLADMGSHCIDVLEVIIGSKVAEVAGFNDAEIQGYKNEDSSACILRFANGAHGFVDSYFNIPDAASKGLMEIYGTGGSLSCSGTIGQAPGGKMIACFSNQGGYEAQQSRKQKEVTKEITAKPVRMYASEVDHLSECIMKNKKPWISGEEGLHNLKIVSALYESTRTRKFVRVK